MNLGVPLGVAKIVREIPGDEEESWVDLYNRLYRNRWLFLCKKIDEDIVTKVGGMIIFLNQENPLKDLFLFINSKGGSISDALAIYYLMTELPADVNTVALGTCASSASLILIGGTLTKRSAFRHARIMIHEPQIGESKRKKKKNKDKDKDRDKDKKKKKKKYHHVRVINQRNHLLRIHEKMLDIYIKRSGKALWPILQDLRRDVSMSAEEAKSHGIVDSIANKELVGRMRKGMGMGEDENDEDERKVDR